MSWPTGEAEGVVASFDATSGLGTLRLDDGREVAFHATQLADGTRAIAVATPVTARIVPWHLGGMEATAITAR